MIVARPDGTLNRRNEFGVEIPELFGGNEDNRVPNIAIAGVAIVLGLLLTRLDARRLSCRLRRPRTEGDPHALRDRGSRGGGPGCASAAAAPPPDRWGDLSSPVPGEVGGARGFRSR